MAGATLSGFLRELRRRHVFRVAIAYGAVSWMVLEVASATFPPLGIPAWPLSLLAMLIILGFPVAIVLAWAFDITPAGVQRTPPSAAGERSDDQEPCVTVSTRRPSIAALPFADVSEERRFQFLGDGIADELINTLARRPELRVVARTSSFSFRDGSADVREIAARLDVGYVIEGSIRMTGDRLRINAQLVDAASGFALWSGTYDRAVGDLLTVQDDVARAVTRALPAPVAGEQDEAEILVDTTEDVEAYTHHLRGRLLWMERTPASLRSSTVHFEQAILRDPSFAHAHAGLADSLGILVDYGVADPAVTLPVARQSADRALRLGPHLAEVHAADALVRQLEGDWEGARQAFSHACALNPALSPARQRLALIYAWQGEPGEARRQIALAAERDPLSPLIATSRAWVEYYARSMDAALACVEEVLDEHPRFTHARVPLAMTLLQLGRPSEAAAAIDLYLATAERTPATVALHVHALAAAGDATAAEARMTALQRLARRRYVPAYHLAVACVGVGRYDDALRSLEQAVARREPQLIQLEREPLFDALRTEPAFSDVLARAIGASAPALSKPA
jgi:adenylate cyclase